MKSRNEYYKEYYTAHKEKWRDEYNAKDLGLYLYFIFDENDEIVYIGKTNSLRNRFRLHKFYGDKWKVGEKVLYREFKGITYEELLDIEQHFIEVFKPKRNDRAGDYDTSVIEYLKKDFELKEYIV